MENVPADVLVGILEKLALQDPLSFLQAVASCRAFEAAAEGNPVLWKQAFHGSPKERRIWALRNYLPAEGAKLGAEVESLGGCKRLLKGYWANGVVDEPEQNALKGFGLDPVPRTCFISEAVPFPTLRDLSFAVFVWLRGVLVAYGVYYPQEETERTPGVRVVRLSLRPLYSFPEIKQSLGDAYTEGRSGGIKSRGFDELSAELFFPGTVTGVPCSSVKWRGTYTKGMERANDQRSRLDFLELDGMLLANAALPFETSRSRFSSTMVFNCGYNSDWTFQVRQYIF